MNSMVVGMGEIGKAIYSIVSKKFLTGFKDLNGVNQEVQSVEVMHVCFPYSDNFQHYVAKYFSDFSPKHIVIHSTVPVGTTNNLSNMLITPVCYSPVRGKHPDLEKDLLKYVKYIASSCDQSINKLKDYFCEAGFRVMVRESVETLELGKLLSLSRYGVYLAFAKEQERMCNMFGLSYSSVVTDFEITRNQGVAEHLKQPILTPFDKFVGGHCVVENMEMLSNQLKNKKFKGYDLLVKSIEINKGTIVWDHCNIYPTAKIGKGVSIGNFCEIGENVVIGNGSRIGAFCFIPEGVTIGENVFVAPKVTFSNDKHPPSKRECWGKIVVKDNAMIGMNSTILPGVTIGESAIIGAGSVVTKNVGDNELWYGVAAQNRTNGSK